MFTNPLRFLYFAAALLICLTIHESAHALVADRLGDPTARRLGRISLNPIRHLDPTGTLLILMSSLLGIGFGWGKPVPVDPRYLRFGPKTGMAIVAAAGPGSNLLLAGLLALVVQADLSLPSWLATGLLYTIIVSVSLAVFNLIPLPPLDGFSVLLGFLPLRPARALYSVAQYGPALLMLLVFLGGSLLGQYLNFFSTPILRALGIS